MSRNRTPLSVGLENMRVTRAIDGVVHIGVHNIRRVWLWVHEVGVQVSPPAVTSLDVGDFASAVSIKVTTTVDMVDSVGFEISTYREGRTRTRTVTSSNVNIVFNNRARVLSWNWW